MGSKGRPPAAAPPLPLSRRGQAEQAAAALQQQLEQLHRGARATAAERDLQAKKMPSTSQPLFSSGGRRRGEEDATALSAAEMPLEMLSWGLDTPVGSARAGARRRGGAADGADDELSGLSDEDEDELELMVITPPLGSPLASMRSEDGGSLSLGGSPQEQVIHARREVVQIL